MEVSLGPETLPMSDGLSNTTPQQKSRPKGGFVFLAEPFS